MNRPTNSTPTRSPSSRRRRARERGQVLVIFAGAIFLFMLLLAVVIDVSWYWANTLRVQRAADAAALAGVVWLPSCPDASAGAACVGDNAHDTALAEAKRNGYTDGVNGTTVTTSSDPDNNRRLRVSIRSNVNTYFMRVMGISSIPASRNSKAEFVLPVPMGSPQNYYGVGQFLGTTKNAHTSTGTTTADGDTGWGDVPTAAPAGGQWTASSGTIQAAVASATDNIYARTSTTNFAQQWNTFHLVTGVAGSPIPSPGANQTLTILGLQVRLSDAFLSASCANSNIKVDLSWGNGSVGPPTTWSTAIATPSLTTTNTTDYTLPAAGGDTSTAAWGAHTWALNDFADGSFRVRLTSTKGCATATTFNVDQLEVRVYYRMATTTTTTTYTYDENAGPTPVSDPASPSSALAPQNFWGAIFTKGGVRQNGDYYAPSTIGGSASGAYSPTTGPNPTYDAGGYDYTVDLTGAIGGEVRLFDPIFCATGANKTSGWYGAGDHWTTQGSSGNTVIAPVAVTFRLYNMGSNLYSTIDDTLVATRAYDPGGMTLGDFSGSVGNPTTSQADSTHNGIQNVGRGDAQDCSLNPAHNAWVTLASGLAGGMYRVNVETSSQAANQTVGAENLFAIWVNGSGGKARVYGGGRMAGYTQVGAAPQSFYLAQIEAVHAGKTLEIKLFDPGDVSGNAFLYIQSPDGNAYNNATFDYTADAGCKAGNSDVCSATGRQYIQTAKNGSSSFDNSVITITIHLPRTYGSGGLTPPGVPGADAASRAGWWRIYYDVTNANDTTTWQVNIRGNPVHLVIP
jgi:Flp pilus assembly protein TadG